MKIAARVLTSLLAAALLPAPAAHAQDDLHESGRALAQRLCAPCHAIGAAQRSPNAAAPPFRHLEPRIDLSDLAERMKNGLIAGHPEMPVFVLHDHEARALVTYLRSVQNDSKH